MSSREEILKNIKANQPDITLLPAWTWPANDQNIETFMRSLKGIGGNVLAAAGPESIQKDLLETYGTDKRIVNNSKVLNWKGLETKGESSQSMEQIEVAILEGELGVAENGAVWVDENYMMHRVVPFICQHLVIILHEHSIVSNMHEAYARIDITKSGFGAFIAGPSKTADIEQSLVIGAHGARSLTVYITRG